MIKVLFLERALSFENSFNNFLYFLSQIPFIKVLITEDSYERNVPKKILSVVNFVLSVVLNFVGKCVYTALFLLLPYLVMKNFVVGNHFSYENTIINIFIMMNCICGSLISTAVLSDGDEEYMLLNIMRTDPVKHYQGKIFFRLLTDVVFFYLILLGLGIGAAASLKLAGILLASRGIGELLRLVIYDKLPWLFDRLLFLDVCVIVACVYFAYVSPFYKGYMPGLDALALEQHVYLAVMALGLLGICVVWFYKKYDLLAKRKVKLPDVKYQEQVKARARIQAAKTESIQLYRVGRQDNKKKFAYLNALFFERCGKLAQNEIRARVYLVIILTAVGSLWLYFADAAGKNAIWKTISTHPAWFVLIMFLVCASYKMCQILYYNCDRMLLEFSYYRTKSAIKENFISRVIRLIGFDLITAAFICAGLMVLAYNAGHIGDIKTLIPVFEEIAALSILFSIYHASLYHILQPYNRKMAVKVPLFNLCNGIVLLASLIMCFIPVKVTLLLALTVAADIAAVFLSYKLVGDYGVKYFKNR